MRAVKVLFADNYIRYVPRAMTVEARIVHMSKTAIACDFEGWVTALQLRPICVYEAPYDRRAAPSYR